MMAKPPVAPSNICEENDNQLRAATYGSVSGIVTSISGDSRFAIYC